MKHSKQLVLALLASTVVFTAYFTQSKLLGVRNEAFVSQPAPAKPVADEEAQPPAAAKLPAVVYYSKNDPKWRPAEKVVDEAVKKYAFIELKKISIDDADGYKQLAAAETDLKIKNTGDITFIFGPVYLTSKGERRDVENYVAPMLSRLDPGQPQPPRHKGRMIPDVNAYIADMFGPGASHEPAGNTDDAIQYYRVNKNGAVAGWAVSAYHSIVCPICNDTQFLLALDPTLQITDIRPVRALELYGGKIPDAVEAKFLAQFKKFQGGDKLLRVDAMTGATKTSYSYEAVINEVMETLKKREKK